jgi:hypothetical protein
MIHKIGISSIFAAVLAAGLIIAAPLEFTKAQQPLMEAAEGSSVQAAIDELMTVHPMLSELEADEAAADLAEAEDNQMVTKLASMNGTEAVHLLLALEALEALKDLHASEILLESNQTVS